MKFRAKGLRESAQPARPKRVRDLFPEDTALVISITLKLSTLQRIMSFIKYVLSIHIRFKKLNDIAHKYRRSFDVRMRVIDKWERRFRIPDGFVPLIPLVKV